MLVYFAAPLFSQAECYFNQCLSEKLEVLGYQVFLPQRDGAERDRPPYDKMTREERRLAMFHLDTTKIMESDVFLFVLDGRVPHEGACVELGIAYSHKKFQHPNKFLIGLHTDVRSAFIGSKLNPMICVPLEYIASNERQLLQVLEHYQNFQTITDFVEEV
jgi:Nucleoside 2-deoxyribosyltransferase